MALVRLSVSGWYSRAVTDMLGQERSIMIRIDGVALKRGFVHQPESTCLENTLLIYSRCRDACARSMVDIHTDYVYPARGGSIFDHIGDEMKRLKDRQLQQLHRP